MFPRIFRIFTLVWSLIGLVHCVTVTIQNPSINVTVGNSATLGCTYALASSNTQNLIVQWTFLAVNSHLPVAVYAYQNGVPYTEGRFKNQVMAANSTGNATITISNMQPQDTGFYTCSVSNLPEPESQGQVHVIVQVPPSTPHCSIEGNMAVGHNVKLSCLSGQGMPLPYYTWNRVKNGVVMPVNVAQQNGVMVIGNLTKFEDGYYRCTASNSLGNATCELDLHTGGEAGVIVGALIGAVILAAIIIAVIWFLIVKKKHKSHKATEMKTMATPSRANTVQAETEEHTKQNLVVSESPEVREYRDQPEHAAPGHVEDPSV